MSHSQIPIFISAGDPSGDVAGSHLLEKLKLGSENISFFGLGGRRMNAAGQAQLVDGSKLAVLGFWEVARKYFFFKKLLSQTVKLIIERKPKAIILIDYPGFNLRLAEKVKSLGIPIIYYISPQIWAWGAKRIGQIKRLVDLMLLILPFEKKIYDEAGVSNRLVGHYLLDDIDPRFIKAPYNPKSDLIVLMPGSRPQEVQRMLPVLLRAAGIISRSGKWRFAVAAVEGGVDYPSIMINSSMDAELVTGRTRELIAESRLVITSSGTATLETGIIGRPMVVIYRTGLLTYLIARRLVTLDMIALVNVTAGRKVVPELIQHDATPKKIADAAGGFLEDDSLSLAVVGELNKTADRLGGPGGSGRAANAIREIINC
ncbi:MAG: lipid-A-disaccharide synthase [Candidatus Zixiibacteriota bacterium]|nr:MAG: lipid-A-disaccharide synthase [candidate division Zixibacteria bacterium]